MHERLARSELGVSEELRRRLAQSFAEEDQNDVQTRQLAADIVALVREVQALARSTWHEHPDVHRALKEAVQVLLEARAPEKSPAVQSMAVRDLFGFSGDAATIGRTVAHLYLQRKGS